MGRLLMKNCNMILKKKQQKYTFVTNKSFGQLLGISPKIFIFLKLLITNLHVLKYDLLIKVLNHYR